MKSWKKRRREGLANAIRQHQRRAKVKRTFWYRIRKFFRMFIGNISSD
jgi:hypothetical protein